MDLTKTAFSLQFDRNGAVRSLKEQITYAKKLGICHKCGRQTHKPGKLLTKVPLTNSKVYNGTCLLCFPEKRPPHMKGDDFERLSNESASLFTEGACGDFSGPKRKWKRPKKKKKKREKEKRAGANSAHTHGSESESSLDENTIFDDTSVESSKIHERKPSGNRSDSHLYRHHKTPVTFAESAPLCGLKASEAYSESTFSESFHEVGNGLHGSLKVRWDDDEVMFKSEGNLGDAWDVVKTMRDNKSDPKVLRISCNQLRSIGNNQAGAMHEIIPAMSRFEKDWKLQAAACGGIWGLSAESDDKKGEACDAGCIDSIVSAIKKTPNSSTLLKWAYGTLSCLAHGLGVREQIANSGAVGVVVSGLREHSHLQDMLHWSCRALFNFVHLCPDELYSERSLVFGVDDAEFKEEERWAKVNIAESKKVDAVAAVLYAMQQQTVHYTSHELAFKFVCFMADNDVIDDSKDMSILQLTYEEKGIAICTAAIKAFKVSSEITIELAIGLLSALLEIAGSDKFARARIEDIVESILLSVQEFSSNDFIQERSLFLLRNMCYLSDEIKAVVIFSGGMNIIAGAMKRHFRNCLIQEYGLWTIWSCSGSSVFVADDTESHFETKIVANAMKDFTTDVNIQVAGIGILSNLFTLVGTVPDFNSILDHILKVMSSLENESSVQEQACAFIYVICTKDKMKAKNINEHTGILPVIKAMQNFRDEFGLQRAGCCALAALAAIDDASKQAIINYNGIGAIMQAMEKYSELRQLTLQALSFLSLCSTTENSIADGQVFESIVRVLNQTKNHVEIYHTYAALKNLALHTRRHGEFTFSVTSSTDAVLKKSAALVTNQDLVLEALGALWALARGINCSNKIDTDALVGFIVDVIRIYRGDTGIEFNEEINYHAFGVLVAVSECQADEFVAYGPQLIDCILSVMYICAQELTGDPSRFSNLVHVAMRALLNLSQLSASETTIIRLGGIVAIIDAMMVHYNVNEVQTVGCSLLARLSRENLEVKICIAETDGVDIIVSAMMSNPMDVELQKSAIDTLSNLSVDSESREFVAQQGGLMLIANAMGNLKDEYILQEKAADALCTLASDAQEELIMQSQAIPAVIECMKHHRNILDVQLKLLRFLQKMSMKNTALKRAIVDAGGIGAITTVVEEHLTSTQLLVEAFTVIWSLAVLNECKQIISESNFIYLLINGMMANVDSEHLQKQACGALCTLSSHSGNNNLINTHNGTGAIVYAMRVHFGSESIQTEACRALSSMTTNHSEESNAIGAEIDAIIAAMDCFPHAYGLHENGLLVLRGLSMSPRTLDLMRERSESVEKVLRKCLSNQRSSFIDEFPSTPENAALILSRLDIS